MSRPFRGIHPGTRPCLEEPANPLSHSQMFSVINEIKDNSPGSIVGVISTSIGSAASIYVLVAITGYFTFGNTVLGNIVMMYPPSIASTIGKAAIVILVMFSVPLQVHPCRASLDAVLKWRPNRSGSDRPSSPSNRSLLPTAAGPTDSHGAPIVAMSELRFALLTTFIIVLSYITALTISQLDRVLAYVGATGSTSISFILPGLFYYKISDPNSIHHQRLAKEDDDVDVNGSEESDTEVDQSRPGILEGAGGIRSGGSGSHNGLLRMIRRWRWDMEHIEHGLLRRLALCLAIYGFCVMIVCLILNTFFTVAH